MHNQPILCLSFDMFLIRSKISNCCKRLIAILGVALARFAISSVRSWSISSASIEVHLELFLRYLLFDKIERTGVC